MLATLPSSTIILGSIGAYSSPFFTELLPWGLLFLGFIVGGCLISLLIMVVAGAFSDLANWRPKDKE